ncbi:MAG: helix-hairpin-helix domain-containing protein [Candidatus Omnitrophica bacterium]|nr:helix-hairpin-helix domain-containing protein [Candidatus Omnitrophota bacterium]
MGKNTEIADIFERIADALEFKGELVFKVNAYRKAARVLREFSGDISAIHPSEIEGIGKGMVEKIEEYLKTGNIVAGNPTLHNEILREVKDVFKGVIDR